MVSFDIWDTILKRKCHPEEIKLHTCQYLFFQYRTMMDYKSIYELLKLRNEIEYTLCEENVKQGLDKECDIELVFRQMNEKIFKNPIPGLEEELIKVEIEHEKKMSYVNPEILKLLEKYENYDLYCISDFYMNSKYIKQILEDKHILDKFKKIYSSADYFLTKRSARLFEKVKDELKMEYEEMLHIGDNSISDNEIPKKLGITTIKIENQNEFPHIKNRKLNIQDMITIQDKNSLFDIGKQLAIIPYYFILKILMEENCKNTRTIYYFTRE